MKRVVTTASGLVLAFAVSVAAQSGSTSGTQGTSGTSGTTGTSGSSTTMEDQQSTSTSGTVTVTGCLSGSGSNWMLTNATMSGSGSGSSYGSTSGTTSGSGSSTGSSAGTTGSTAGSTSGTTSGTSQPGQSSTTSGSAAAGMTASSYRLIATDTDKLSDKVGKKVEVTGTLDQSSSSSSGAGSTGSTAGTGTGSTAGTGTGSTAGTGTGSTSGTTGTGSTGSGSTYGSAGRRWVRAPRPSAFRPFARSRVAATPAATANHSRSAARCARPRSREAHPRATLRRYVYRVGPGRGASRPSRTGPELTSRCR
jgi:hypothetical protein